MTEYYTTESYTTTKLMHVHIIIVIFVGMSIQSMYSIIKSKTSKTEY